MGSIGNSLVRIEKLNALSRRLCAAQEDPTKVKEEVAQICSKQTYSKSLMLLSAAIAAGGFAVFFGGSLIDGLIAAGIGVFVMKGFFVGKRNDFVAVRQQCFFVPELSQINNAFAHAGIFYV